MREIKFRAFWKDTLKEVKDFSSEYLIDTCNDEIFIVNQFTGLQDKNGNEIYEGDILFWNKSKCIVFWDEKKFGFYIEWLTGPCFKIRKTFENFPVNSNVMLFEVIGNIHKNPELLKGEQKRLL